MNPYEELYHHGIDGQHWGVRRYQNEDGSLASLSAHSIKNDVRTTKDMARVRNYSDSYKEAERRAKEQMTNTYDKLKKKVTDK